MLSIVIYGMPDKHMYAPHYISGVLSMVWCLFALPYNVPSNSGALSGAKPAEVFVYAVV